MSTVCAVTNLMIIVSYPSEIASIVGFSHQALLNSYCECHTGNAVYLSRMNTSLACHARYCLAVFDLCYLIDQKNTRIFCTPATVDVNYVFASWSKFHRPIQYVLYAKKMFHSVCTACDENLLFWFYCMRWKYTVSILCCLILPAEICYWPGKWDSTAILRHLSDNIIIWSIDLCRV